MIQISEKLSPKSRTQEGVSARSKIGGSHT